MITEKDLTEMGFTSYDKHSFDKKGFKVHIYNNRCFLFNPMRELESIKDIRKAYDKYRDKRVKSGLCVSKIFNNNEEEEVE